MAAVKARFWKKGEVLDHTASAAMVGGTPFQIGNQCAIPFNDFASGVTEGVAVEGIFKVQATVDTGSIGDPIYWDANGSPYGGTALSGAFTTDSAAGDWLCGTLVVADKGATDTHMYLNLNRGSVYAALSDPIAFLDAVTMAGDLALAGDVTMVDDKTITFGTDSNATIGYDETTDDALEITCAAITLAGAVSVTGHLTMANTKDILPATASGSDLGSATAEWGAIFVGDDKAISLGDGQDATIMYDETTDDALEITCAAITLAGAVSVTGNLTMANTKDILAATVGGSDLGGASNEWGDIFMADNKGLKFGDGQDVSILWDGTNLVVTGLPTSDPSSAGALYTTGGAVMFSAG